MGETVVLTTCQSIAAALLVCLSVCGCQRVTETTSVKPSQANRQTATSDPPPAQIATAATWGAPSGAGRSLAGSEEPQEIKSLSDTVVLKLTPHEQQVLATWYQEVQPRRTEESFGELVARTALAKLGQPYDNHRYVDSPETLQANVEAFHCVSLIETAIAVASCIALNRPTQQCYAQRLQTLRYRDGHIEGYASRLHYFTEWLTDNERRGQLQLITGRLGGQPQRRHVGYMTAHPRKFPLVRQASVRRAIAQTEATLSRQPMTVLAKPFVRKISDRLASGDVIAVVSDKPDLVVSHTGFVYRTHDGIVRLLHASSYQQRVVLTAGDIAAYLHHRPSRIGVMVARPIEPSPAIEP